jgi:hypothetical protein
LADTCQVYNFMKADNTLISGSTYCVERRYTRYRGSIRYWNELLERNICTLPATKRFLRKIISFLLSLTLNPLLRHILKTSGKSTNLGCARSSKATTSREALSVYSPERVDIAFEHEIDTRRDKSFRESASTICIHPKV